MKKIQRVLVHLMLVVFCTLGLVSCKNTGGLPVDTPKAQTVLEDITWRRTRLDEVSKAGGCLLIKPQADADCKIFAATKGHDCDNCQAANCRQVRDSDGCGIVCDCACLSCGT